MSGTEGSPIAARQLMLTALLVVTLPSAPRAQVAPAQVAPAPADPLARIADAEAKLAGGATEDAVLQLWAVETQLRATPPGAARDAAAASIRSLLERADPLAAARTAAFSATARSLLTMARAYRSRKWNETADALAVQAARFDEAAATKELPMTRPRANARTVDPIDALGHDYDQGTWTHRDGVLCSPTELPATSALYITTTKHEDQRLAMTVDIGDRDAMFGVILGNTGDSYYIVDFHFWAGSSEIQTNIYYYSAAGLVTIGEGSHSSDELRKGPSRIEVLVRGPRIEARVDNATTADLACPTPVRGTFGFYISGASPYRGSLSIRDVALGPLPENEPTPAQLDAAATAAQQQQVTAAIDAARVLLLEKRPEPAALRLRAARAIADRVTAPAARDALLGTIDKLLGANDPLHARREKALGEAAGALRALANAHAAADRLQLAACLASLMAELDPVGQRQAAATLQTRAELARAQARARQQAKAAGSPIDDGALAAWFKGGAHPLGQGAAWQFGFDGAMSPSITRTESFVIATRGDHHAGTASVRFQLPPTGRAGLLFAWQNEHDHLRATVQRHDARLELTLALRKGNSLQVLASTVIDFDVAADGGWVQLDVALGGDRIVARCRDRELAVPAPVPGLHGRFGLVAGNEASTAATIPFRAFTPPTEATDAPVK